MAVTILGHYTTTTTTTATSTLKIFLLLVLLKSVDIYRYDQKNLKELQIMNTLYPIVTPNKSGTEMWIYQDAWLHMGDFNRSTSFEYKINKKGNGVYTFVIDGCAKISDKTLQKRDALGIWDVKNFNISVNKNSKLLLIEVPI